MNLKLKTKADRRQRPARQPLVQKRAKAKEHVRKKEPAKKKEDPCIYCGKNCVKGCVQCAPSGAICPAQACQKKQLKGWKSRQKRWDRQILYEL